MTCVARNYPLLFVGRLLQGGSSGVVWTVGLALLVDTVGSGQVGNAMGTVLYVSHKLPVGRQLGVGN